MIWSDVDFSKESDPAIVGGVVVADFFGGKVSLLLRRDWEKLFKIVLAG